MAKLIHYNLESCQENPDGDSVTLYFDSLPTDKEVKNACLSLTGKMTISALVDDPCFEWSECPTPVSTRANLIRVQCNPCG